jgi:murein tripeptide amidase MpaA
MAADSPYAEVVTYGQSYECRDLKLMKISKPGGRSKKPAVFIESNTHAREWVANAVATYLINELLTGTLTKRLDEFDFYIVPVANPDGYEFSHTDDRMWRKTRRINENSVCVGVDPNRNWDYKWMTGGSSNNTCSDSYAGTQPFTEYEVVSMVDYYKTVVDQVRLFIAIHSYGQVLLFPWGYTADRIPDYDRYKQVTIKAVEALKKVHGSVYNYGSVPEYFGVASGSVLDWMYGMHPEVPLSLAVELRDTGKYGFILPPAQIIPTAQEFIAAFNVYLDNVKS